MAARQERILTTEEIYGLVACLGVDGFNPSAKRDRNLVNRELSDLAGRTTQGHSRPSPHLIIRVSRGRYLYREPDQPMDVALLQEYLEPVEVYEKRPAAGAGVGQIGAVFLTRCGWACMRCSGVCALVTGSTGRITCGSRQTIWWP